jgi:hypothetical protein
VVLRVVAHVVDIVMTLNKLYKKRLIDYVLKMIHIMMAIFSYTLAKAIPPQQGIKYDSIFMLNLIMNWKLSSFFFDYITRPNSPP